MADTTSAAGMGECPNDRSSGRPHAFQVVQGVATSPYGNSSGATMLFCTKCGQSYLLTGNEWRPIALSDVPGGQPSAAEEEAELEPPLVGLGAQRKGQ